jgi:hypothetical protein
VIVMSSSLFMAHVNRRADPCRFCFFFSGIKLILNLIATVSHTTTLIFCITVRLLLMSIVILQNRLPDCTKLFRHCLCHILPEDWECRPNGALPGLPGCN